MNGSSRHRSAAILAAFVVALGAAAGCTTAVAGTPVAGGAAATSSAAAYSPGPDAPVEPPSNGAPNLAQLAGTWTGTYLCNQGETALTLTIVDPAAGASRFDFGPTPGNPTVPTGSYTVAMSLDGADLVFVPLAWVNRPGDYEMVGLRATGPINSATDGLAGTVAYSGCTTFELRRQVAP